MLDSVSTVLLTLDDVKRWQRDKERLTSEVEAVGAKLAAVTQKLDAVKLFLSPEAWRNVLADVAEDGSSEADPQNLHDVVLFALQEAMGGRSGAWLYKKALETPFGLRLQRNRNGIYNAISRLISRDAIVKDRGLYYDAAVFARIQSGEIQDNQAENGEDDDPKAGSTVPELVEQVLRNSNGRASPAEIIAASRKHPLIEEKLRRNPQYLYTVLSRMAHRGKIHKEGGEYVLALDENEAPDGEPSSASDAGPESGVAPLGGLFTQSPTPPRGG